MIAFYDAILVVFIAGYIMLTPFTKVEESFNIQAIHDLIYHGFDLTKFDHIEFPGAVPRTFIGSLIITGLAKPFIGLVPKTALKLDNQLLVRGIIGLLNAVGILYLKDSVVAKIKQNKLHPQDKKQTETKQKQHHKKNVVQKKAHPIEEPHSAASLSIWFAIIQFTQYHVVFYSSRTLPNFLALPLTNYAFGKIIRGDFSTAIAVLSFTTIVFRIEIVALTLSVGLFLYLFNQTTIPQLIKSALVGGLIGSLSSFVVDSYFWQRYTIPELESFIFNVIEGKSSEWGTQPFTQYFSGALFTLFLPPLAPLLAVLGAWKDITGNFILRIIGLSSLLFVVLISFQPHKEWRFIIYIVPVVNILAANGASYIFSKAFKSHLFKFLVLITLGSFSLTALLTSAWAYASSYNYPGGLAITKFHELILLERMKQPNIEHSNNITVHFDVAAAMSGITHFCEATDLLNITINYDKNEDPIELNKTETWESYDYIISEYDLETIVGLRNIPRSDNFKWKKLESIKGFAGIDPRGVRYLNIPAMVRDLIKDKNFLPIVKTLRPFLHITDQLFIYKRVEPSVKKNKKPKKPKVPKEEIIEEIIEETPEKVEEVLEEAIIERIIESPEKVDKIVEDVIIEEIPENIEEVIEKIEETSEAVIVDESSVEKENEETVEPAEEQVETTEIEKFVEPTDEEEIVEPTDEEEIVEPTDEEEIVEPTEIPSQQEEEQQVIQIETEKSLETETEESS